MKNTTLDIAQWTRNIITWALLGIAASQFMDLRDTVKEMHKLTIKHETEIKTNSDEILRLRDKFDNAKLSAR
jgi:hypothetical protein